MFGTIGRCICTMLTNIGPSGKDRISLTQISTKSLESTHFLKTGIKRCNYKKTVLTNEPFYSI
jgi:hypothetical protein